MGIDEPTDGRTEVAGDGKTDEPTDGAGRDPQATADAPISRGGPRR